MLQIIHLDFIGFSTMLQDFYVIFLKSHNIPVNSICISHKDWGGTNYGGGGAFENVTPVAKHCPFFGFDFHFWKLSELTGDAVCSDFDFHLQEYFRTNNKLQPTGHECSNIGIHCCISCELFQNCTEINLWRILAAFLFIKLRTCFV